MNNKLNYDNVVFDCDSTLTKIEGIDELARLRGKLEEVSVLTKQAMEGLVPFESVFGRRLQLINPRIEDLEQVGSLYVKNLVEDMVEVIEMLKHFGVNVYIMSGGYDLPLHILANHLGISHDYVWGNKIIFNERGEYLGFDESIPLWQSGGKNRMLAKLNLSGRTLFIGDSVTDLDTRHCVTHFIGYGGVVVREKVKQEADMFIETESMVSLIPLVLGPTIHQQPLHERYQSLLHKSKQHIGSNKVHFKKKN